jgi:hypothetical protein
MGVPRAADEREFPCAPLADFIGSLDAHDLVGHGSYSDFRLP